MERQPLGVQIGFDLVLNIGFLHHNATEVARCATPFAAPHSQRHRAPQYGKRQTRRPRLLGGRLSIGAGRAGHDVLSVLAGRRLLPGLLSLSNYALTAPAAASAAHMFPLLLCGVQRGGLKAVDTPCRGRRRATSTGIRRLRCNRSAGTDSTRPAQYEKRTDLACQPSRFC